jgi:hypothetical protein
MSDNDADESSVAKGTEYEQLVKGVYETLLKAEGVENITVQHDISLEGKSGCEHQIDIYWEFKFAGQTYKTAIECKAFNKNVSIGRIRDFYGVLTDVPNLNGIFATQVGYQSGAKTYAAHYGISLKEVRPPKQHDWEGRIKDIHFEFNILEINIEEFVPLFSESMKQKLNGQQSLELGFGIHDPLIFDPNGNPVATYENLRGKLPTDGIPFSGREHTLAFPGHTIRTSADNFSIEAVKVRYSAHVAATDMLKISGEELAKAIIKDVLTDSYTFVSKDGTVRQPRSTL